ncbi:trihelix transcription factor ASIL2-like [Asparagus officinalis]|uniref:trihelix transcription factor ASIL2-like n=1 Tax=Asparagus officinalis TaxID=4686 RepID=UPI00098E2B27|nr:trihelix transcription factor ASIL2-like [Asparagus officinalis]
MIADGALVQASECFYDRLDSLIEPRFLQKCATAAIVLAALWRSLLAVTVIAYHAEEFYGAATAALTAGQRASDDDESDSSLSRSSGLYRKRPREMRKERSGKGVRRGEEDGMRELSKAIMSMTEIYEKVEIDKQRQMMELEKQRMEFAKSLEFQRIQMFVDSQVQLMKVKCAKTSNAGECFSLLLH